MAAGFPVKANYVSGEVLTAANMNDLSSTLNYLYPTAKGDLFPASSATALTRLEVGANDTVLIADSSTATGLKWGAPTSGGMTLLSTTTLSGASVTLSSIPSTYNSLRLVIQDFLPATDSTRLCIRFNGDSGANYTEVRSNTAAGGTSINATQANISETSDNAVTNSLIVVDIPDYTNTVTWKMATSTAITNDTTTTTLVRFGINTAIYNQTGAISSITLLPLAGNFTSGTVLFYGVK
jgi:hypothetical protein